MKNDKPNSEIIIYESDDGKPQISVRVENETVWLDAHQMADLFGIDRSGIVKHIKNIYETGELEPKTTCAKIAQVAKAEKEYREYQVNTLSPVEKAYLDTIKTVQKKIEKKTKGKK